MQHIAIKVALLVAAVLAAHVNIRALPWQQSPVVFGRVIDATTGLPVANAVVRIAGEGVGERQSVANSRARTDGTQAARQVVTGRQVITTDDGFFFFRDIPAGKYDLSTTALGYERTSFSLNHTASGNQQLYVPISRLSGISGRVVDEEGSPIVGVTVSALHPVVVSGQVVLRQAFNEAITDDRGHFRLGDLTAGAYVVGVLVSTRTLPSWLVRELDAVTPGKRDAVALRADLSATGLFVSNGDGLRIGDFVVQTNGPIPPPGSDGVPLAYATTFSPGTADVSSATVITLGVGEQRDAVDVLMRGFRTVRVSGTLVGPTGPMSKVAVSLVPTSAVDSTDLRPAGIASTITNEDGQYTFFGITPGAYVARALFDVTNLERTRETLWESRSLTVGDAEITDLSLLMKPGFRVSGRVEFKPSTTAAPPKPPVSRFALKPIGANIFGAGADLLTPDWTFKTTGNSPGKYVINAPTIPGWTLETVTRNGQIITDDVIDLDANLTGLVLSYSVRQSRIVGSVANSKSEGLSAVDVLVFPADTSLWRQGIFVARRERRVKVSPDGSFECAGLAPGDYHVVAIPARFIGHWQDPIFLERLIPGAVTVSVVASSDTSLSLKPYTLTGR